MDNPQQSATDPDLDDRHYIGHITSLSATKNIYTQGNIYTHTGIKLIKHDVRITPGFYEQLTKHKLLKPIDESITVENPIDANKLSTDLASFMADNAFFKQMQTMLPKLQAIVASLDEEDIPPQLNLKLTVLFHQLPDLYQHSLQVTLISFYIGGKLGLPEPTQKNLLLAALFHDIGELHIDPDIAGKNGELDSHGYNQLYAHPVIAHFILNKFQRFKHDICRTILEHHERKDGSGYPRGLQDSQISESGYILAIAEFFAGVYQKYYQSKMADHLRIILSFQNTKFPDKLINILNLLISTANDKVTPKKDALIQDTLQTKLFTLSHVLNDWHKINNYLKEESGHHEERQLAELVNQRLYELHQGILSLGVAIDGTKEFIAMLADDKNSLLEIQVIAQEIQYQLNAIILEIQRRWPNTEFDNSPYRQIKIWIQHIDSTFFQNK